MSGNKIIRGLEEAVDFARRSKIDARADELIEHERFRAALQRIVRLAEGRKRDGQMATTLLKIARNALTPADPA